jgi:hypothetical protein
MTMTIQRQTHFPARNLGLLILLATAVILSVHAFARHGEDAERVRACMDQDGYIQIWYNPLLDRYLRVCEIRGGKFGIQVLQLDDDGIWHEITSFVKNRMKNLGQVERYLQNSGSFKVWPK